MSRPEAPAGLIATVEEVVPQWPARLKRRWVRRFCPHYRVDLLAEDRLRRLLAIALRRGWFDGAWHARRWPLFVRLLEDAAESSGKPLPPAVAVNAFNFAAAVADPADALPASLGEAARRALYVDELLSAEALSPLVHDAAPRQDEAGGAALMSPIVRVLSGGSVHSRGPRWTARPWEEAGLRLLHVVEPFGLGAWDGVSEVGVDGDKLVAWSRPLGLLAHLLPPDFPAQVTRGEPSALERPDAISVPEVGLLSAFAWGQLRVGRTDDGAVAFVQPLGEAP